MIAFRNTLNDPTAERSIRNLAAKKGVNGVDLLEKEYLLRLMVKYCHHDAAWAAVVRRSKTGPAVARHSELGFEAVIPVILRHEGGFSNDPNDPGGATNKGIS